MSDGRGAERTATPARRSTSRLTIIATAATLVFAMLAAGGPLFAATLLGIDATTSVSEPSGADTGSLPSPGGTSGQIATRTILWSAGAALAAVVIGWLPGRRLGRTTGVRGSWLCALLILPVAMPAYAVYHAWWQAWPVGSDLHGWVVRNDLVPTARAITLGVAFVAWSWPIVALSVAAAARVGDGRRDAAMRLDRRSAWRRGLVAARAEAPAAAMGGLLVFVLIAANTTAFDLAQVYAIGNELRAMAALGQPPAALLAVAWPFLVIAVVGAILTWRIVRPSTRRSIGDAGGTAGGVLPPPGRLGSSILIIALALGVIGPVALATSGATGRFDVGTFMRLNGGGLLRSIGIAGLAAAVSAALTILAALAIAGRVRRPIAIAGGLLLITMLVPGFIYTAGAEAFWNRGWPGGPETDPGSPWSPASLVYRTPLILLLAAIARTAAPAILLARWSADGRPRAARELARLDDPRSLPARVRELGPRFTAAVIAAAALSFVFVLADASVIVRLAPPGFDPIAGTLLNAMHYQRVDTVLIGLVVIGLAAGVAALAVGLGTGVTGGRIATPWARSIGSWCLVLVAVPVVLVASGCDTRADAADAGVVVPLPAPVVHGESGTGTGQFSYPRAISADTERERIYVIDKTARVQVFGPDGEHLLNWRMPRFDRGKPTGVSVGPDGTVWVADTHENRVMAFTPEGIELLRFGSGGTEDGQFVYPTDVAVAADGRLFVSEYGGNDRIQVFEADGTYVRGFGTFGEGDGCFNRPQALLFSPDRTRLYVADSCNHRIVVVDPETGAFLEEFGEPGTEAGQFHYPYDLTWFDDDVLLVSEFGNNRIQLVRTDGTSLGRFGGVGADAGLLKYPWGAVRVGGSVYVLDSGNNRVQSVPARRLR